MKNCYEALKEDRIPDLDGEMTEEDKVTPIVEKEDARQLTLFDYKEAE